MYTYHQLFVAFHQTCIPRISLVVIGSDWLKLKSDGFQSFEVVLKSSWEFIQQVAVNSIATELIVSYMHALASNLGHYISLRNKRLLVDSMHVYQ